MRRAMLSLVMSWPCLACSGDDKAQPAKAECPSVADLEAVLEPSELGSRVASTKLRNIRCAEGFASAETIPPPDADGAFVLFQRDGAGWKPINVGTGGVCGDLVPAEVQTKLNCPG